MNIAQADPLPQVKDFVAKSGTTVPVLYDEGQVITTKYQVKFTPHMVLIDKNGYIVSVTRELPIDGIREIFGEKNEE